MSRRDESFFIYPRDKNNKRTGHCIAIILREGSMFEGTALCSSTDQFSKKEGRLIAFQRAEEAYMRYLSRCRNKLGEGN